MTVPFYTDFEVCPDDAPYILELLVSAAHGANSVSAAHARVAMAFPTADWARNAPGRVLRVFADSEAVLQAFILSAIPSRVIKRGGATASLPKEAPFAAEWGVYVRDRSSERRTPAALARRERRRAKRETDWGRPTVPRVEGPCIHVGLHSKSEQRSFQLNVRIETDVGRAFNALNLNSYGLSGADTPCAVPLF